MEAEEQPVAKQRRSVKRERKKPSGYGTMGTEASKALVKNGETIAEKLAEKAKAGYVKCIELLYKLAKDIAVQESREDGPALTRSYAVRFASEAEWNDEAADESARGEGSSRN